MPFLVPAGSEGGLLLRALALQPGRRLLTVGDGASCGVRSRGLLVVRPEANQGVCGLLVQL